MRHRAYSLPLILIVVALLATSLSILMTTVVTSSTTATRLFRRTQAGYAIRGAARAAAAAAGDALLQRPSQPAVLPASPAARSAAIAAHLQGLATEVNVELAALTPSLTPAAFILDSVAIDGIQERRSGPIQEGAFRGMNGLIQPFDLVVLGHHEEMESGSYIRIATTVERVFIPMFQFFAFIDG